MLPLNVSQGSKIQAGVFSTNNNVLPGTMELSTCGWEPGFGKGRLQAHNQPPVERQRPQTSTKTLPPHLFQGAFLVDGFEKGRPLRIDGLETR